MKKEFTKEELKNIAAQLRSPHGQAGIETGESMAEKNAFMTRATLEIIRPVNGESILEIGFGNGAHIPEILERGDDITYTGIDISELMVNEAVSRNRRWAGNGRAAFHHTDGVTIPFEEGRFDRVFSVNTLYFWEEPASYMQQICQVLKPAGRAAITFGSKRFMESLPVTNFGFRIYETGEAEDLMKSTGFEETEVYLRSETIESPFGDKMEREFVVLVGFK